MKDEFKDSIMTFEEVCKECLKNNEFVSEFCRLRNIKLPYQRNGIETAIDKACGYDANMEFIRQFTRFVMRTIYIPLITGKI